MVIMKNFFFIQTSPLMIVTQKITSLAFSVHDGRHGNKDMLSDLQKRYRIR